MLRYAAIAFSGEVINIPLRIHSNDRIRRAVGARLSVGRELCGFGSANLWPRGDRCRARQVPRCRRGREPQRQAAGTVLRVTGGITVTVHFFASHKRALYRG